MSAGLSFIIFIGGRAESDVECAVREVQRAVALDTVEMALTLDFTERVIVVTDSDEVASEAARLSAIVERTHDGFHFGQTLRAVARRYGVRNVFYIGGGSTALLTAAEIEAIGREALAGDNRQVPNNFWSSDFVAFTPADALERIDLPASDNNLAFLLERQAGLVTKPARRTLGTTFDIDTPTDVLALKLHGGAGPRASRALAGIPWSTRRLREAARHLMCSDSEVIVAGRVSSGLIGYLETATAGRTRVFSEERGMRASGRDERGEVRSLLGYCYQHLGPERFFTALASLGNTAFWDSRVLFSHLGLRLSVRDRFLSDLGIPEDIEDETARSFTAAAIQAPIPIALGGHGIVAGSLWALIDATGRTSHQLKEGR